MNEEKYKKYISNIGDSHCYGNHYITKSYYLDYPDSTSTSTSSTSTSTYTTDYNLPPYVTTTGTSYTYTYNPPSDVESALAYLYKENKELKKEIDELRSLTHYLESQIIELRDILEKKTEVLKLSEDDEMFADMIDLMEEDG